MKLQTQIMSEMVEDKLKSFTDPLLDLYHDAAEYSHCDLIRIRAAYNSICYNKIINININQRSIIVDDISESEAVEFHLTQIEWAINYAVQLIHKLIEDTKIKSAKL